MKIFKNKIFLVIGSILLILIITNPNNGDFKNYLIAKGNNRNSVEKIKGGRVLNFFLFSIYEINRGKNYNYPTALRCIGILDNFIVLVDHR